MMWNNSLLLLGITFISFSHETTSNQISRPSSSIIVTTHHGGITQKIRGGSTKTTTTATTTISTEEIKDELSPIQKYKLQQQHLLQLRSTYLSEALAARGIHVGPTMVDVSTPEGSKPPQVVDWDCCLSTEDDPKTCLYSFDAEPNTKVVCPTGTTQYISLGALNRLRRTDPSKVEPMWHSQYAILKSWFSDQSEYSLMQFVGFKGFVVSTLLLDLGKGMALKGLIAFSILSILIICMPIIEMVVSRILTSSFLWMKWGSWGRWVHAALPLKILIGQMVWKFLAGSFAKLEGVVKEYIVDLECAILEESIPVTVGGDIEMDSISDVDTGVSDMDEDDDEEEEDDEDDDEYDSEDDDDDDDE